MQSERNEIWEDSQNAVFQIGYETIQEYCLMQMRNCVSEFCKTAHTMAPDSTACNTH